jgi:hypothetical protein
MRILAGIFVFILGSIYAQAQRDPLFPKSMIVSQFAGSTGLASAGFSKVTARDKIELGLLYGYLPKAYGGNNHSLSLKFAWNPWQFKVKRLSVEPVQLGAFICQNFNKNLEFTWGNNYPKNYYWWPRSTRFHPTHSTQLAYVFDTKRLDRLAYYFEANTNDLYIASWYPNRKALSLYDIIFFGMGLKLYLK